MWSFHVSREAKYENIDGKAWMEQLHRSTTMPIVLLFDVIYDAAVDEGEF